MWDSIPAGITPKPKADTQPLSHPGIPVCFLLKCFRVRKTTWDSHTIQLQSKCQQERQRRWSKKNTGRKQHEFSLNYSTNYESFPRFPPNSQNTKVEGLQHTCGRRKKNKENTSRHITVKLLKTKEEKTLKPTGVGSQGRKKAKGAARRLSVAFAQSNGNWEKVVHSS